MAFSPEFIKIVTAQTINNICKININDIPECEIKNVECTSIATTYQPLTCGNLLVVGCNNGEIFLFNYDKLILPSLNRQCSIKTKRPVSSISMDTYCKKLAVTWMHHKIIIIDLKEYKRYLTIKNKQYKFSNANFSPDDSKLIASSENNIILWNSQNGDKLLEINTLFHIRNIMFIDNHYIISCNYNNEILVHNTNNGKCIRTIKCNEPIDNVKIITYYGKFYEELLNYIFSSNV